MIELGAIALLRPWWLIAVPAVVILGYFCPPFPTGLGGWDKAVEHKLLAGLKQRGAVVPATGRHTLASVLVGVIIAFALVGPALERENKNTFRNLDATVIVFDVSRSIAAGGHLPEARNAARAIVEAAGSRQVALIAYAGDAYLVSPFTTDHDGLSTTILALDEQTVPDPGSRPTRAILLARRALAESNIAQGDVVLISDGGGIDATTLREGEALASASRPLTTLFVAAKLSMPDTAPLPDRARLEALAISANGVTGDVLDPSSTNALLRSHTALRLGQGDYAVLAWSDYGRLLVAGALIPALFLFRRRA
jgi:Ca-activated chloride channel homolog